MLRPPCCEEAQANRVETPRGKLAESTMAADACPPVNHPPPSSCSRYLEAAPGIQEQRRAMPLCPVQIPDPQNCEQKKWFLAKLLNLGLFVRQ